MENYKVLISQPRPLSDRNPYAEMAEKYGVQFDFRQLIHIEGLSAKEFRQQRINLQDYTAIVVNSRLAIDHFFRMCEEMRVSVPETMHYYCISEAVGNYLVKYIQFRKRRVFFGPNNSLEELIPAMLRRPSEKYLMIMSDISNTDAIDMFASHGIEVRPAVMYRTVASEWPKSDTFDHNMLVLFTPAGVQSVLHNFPDFRQEDRVIACFGQNTIQAAEAAGWNVQIKAPTSQFPSIAAAIDHYLEEQKA